MLSSVVLTAALLTQTASAPLAYQAQGTQGPGAAPNAASDLARWQKQAAGISIVRDSWGIAHVYGKTDADAVFGMVYTQDEDDFNRVETNYLTSLGMMAQAEGESRVYQDLRQRMYTGEDALKKDYAASPEWLKKLMVAFADGNNYFLATHPDVHPRALTHFEPWMALSFTEGSIGGDIEKINLGGLQTFYGKVPAGTPPPPDSLATVDDEPRGSNGAAVAPSITSTHHAMLLINPHTSFFFRSELQMTSDEGLEAYGAVTWGQIFIYQGFNSHVGWMHTSSAVDATDQFLETVTKQGDHYVYKHGNDELPVTQEVIKVPYKTDAGMQAKTFTIYRTQHGPIVAQQGDKWVAFAMMNEPVKALQQSYLRTKATDYKSFKDTLELHTNSSNNTIFASANGDIAYWHGNYIPRRDPKFDWTRPVDGSDPATDYKGLLSVEETPQLHNPASGWLYNSNNSPWSAAGPSSPKKADFPAYVDSGVESARGLHAIRVLSARKDFTLDGLRAAAFDSYQTWFEKPIPALVKAWDATPDSNPLKAKTKDQIALLRNWDCRWGAESVQTSLAIFWADDIQRKVSGEARQSGQFVWDYLGSGKVAPDVMLQSLANASDKLTADFGKWNTPWGDINRFQRITDDIAPKFTDDGPSIPVEFSSATWGSLASFGARAYPGTKKWYGTSGNSFVAVIEFGPKVTAMAVTAGGESGDPKSPHFDDEAQRYATGNLRPVYFYKDDVLKHVEKQYTPGR